MKLFLTVECTPSVDRVYSGSVLCSLRPGLGLLNPPSFRSW